VSSTCLRRVRLKPDTTSCRRQRRAEFAKDPATAAVLHVLKLYSQTIRVGEVQLRCAAFGAAAIRHAQRDVGDERRTPLPLLLFESVADEQLGDEGRVEVLHRHTRMI